MNIKPQQDRMLALGMRAWLSILNDESDKLSLGAQSALNLLNEDINMLLTNA